MSKRVSASQGEREAENSPETPVISGQPGTAEDHAEPDETTQTYGLAYGRVAR